MTEFSLPWPETSGPVVGDGREYTDAEWRQVWRVLFQGANAAGEAVVPSAGDLTGQLAVTSPGANQIAVATGAALVDGIFYINDASAALAPASAGAGTTRKDRVVVRATWSAGAAQYTARLAIKEGDAVNPPALTQARNATWEVSLASYTINDAGTISGIIDERKFLHMPTRVRAGMVDTQAIGNAQLRNSAGVSVIGRAANSAGAPADIAAGANDRLLARVSNILQWVQVTIGMIPDFLITEAKLAAAVAAKLVTNGNSHDHNGGDGAQIPEGGLAAGVTAKLVTNGNSHDHAGGDGAQIPTAGIASDAVDDTKVGNRVPQFYRRQGGSDSNWALFGTTTYTPAMVRMQAGTGRWTGGPAASGGTTITFPTAFGNIPIVLVTTNNANVIVAYTVNSASKANISWATRDGSNIGQLDFFWLAVGQE